MTATAQDDARGDTRDEGSDAVLVVVVAYGDEGLLDRALASLDAKVAVVVVDNSSSARTREVAERHGATYVDPGANVGFAAAVNLGMSRRRPGGDVLLLNPDARIEGRDVGRLARALHEEPRVACVAPVQHAPGVDALDRVFWPLPSPRRAWLEAVGLGRLGDQREFLIGSVLLLKGAAIDEVGGFDEGYFLYAEEADWQLRARRRGWSMRLCPDVVAEHVGAGTSSDPGERERQFHASQARFVRKWYGPFGWQSYRVAQIVGATGRAFVRGRSWTSPDTRRALLYLRDPGVCRAVSSTSVPGGASARKPSPTPRRRVVHVVCTDAFAGVERYVVSVATGLAGRGWDVVVVGGDQEQMPRELSPAGVTWYPGATVAAAAARLALLRRFDVVHAHMTEAELVAVSTRASHRAPIVATRHFAAKRGSSRPARALAPVLARVVSSQLAISEYVAGKIEGRSVVVRPGVRSVNEVVAGAAREPVVLMVQRLEQEKHVDVGIAAFACSRLAMRGWRLVVAGDGAAAAELRKHAERLGVGEACDFLGAVSDVDALYRRASIFLATRPDEPYGISVVEAMAWGIPVVAVRGGGHLETVGLTVGAALFSPDDHDGAAAHLVRLADDPHARSVYGDALRRVQKEHLDVVRQVDETVAVYDKLTSRVSP